MHQEEACADELPHRLPCETMHMAQEIDEDMRPEPVEKETGADEWPERIQCETWDPRQDDEEDIFWEATVGGEGADRSEPNIRWDFDEQQNHAYDAAALVEDDEQDERIGAQTQLRENQMPMNGWRGYIMRDLAISRIARRICIKNRWRRKLVPSSGRKECRVRHRMPCRKAMRISTRKRR